MKLSSLRVWSAALALASLSLLGLLYRKSAECDRKTAMLDTLYQHAKAAEQAAVDSRRRVDSLSVRLAGLKPSPIEELYVGRLRARGLKDPVADLIGDLQGHPEIIPYPGVLGGRMGFYDRDRIRVLSDSWVYAPFDDGHISGEAILEYRVAPRGTIAWRVLKSRMQ